MSAGAYLPAAPRPPHDPLWLRLDGRTGFRLAEVPVGAHPRLVISGTNGALTLPFEPGSARVLGEAAGSLGGLMLPGAMAIDGPGRLWLLDRARRALRRFDPCACVFRDAPCQGLALADPLTIAADRNRLYVADSGPPGRLLVLDVNAMSVRAVWQPPAHAAPQPWQPTAIATRGGRVWVADRGNGAIHCFTAWGGWTESVAGTGTISRLAFDCHGRLFAVVPGRDDVDIYWQGKVAEKATDPATVAGTFPPAPLPVSRSGAINLAGWCVDAAWFGANGEPLPASPDDAVAYAPAGAVQTISLDSRIARCQWHRVVLAAAIPGHASVSITTATAETALSDEVVAGLPDDAWSQVPLTPGATEALIFSGPGRYLWLRIALAGDGSSTPELCRLDIEYPRISLRRYLPAAMGADAISAAFLDRFLGVFDRGLRDLEAKVDQQAALFDPRSTPAMPGRDMLAWLASWIGVSLDKRWPEARRRRMVRSAASLFACRGTWAGLRGSLLLWLGWDRFEGMGQTPAACAPACTPATMSPGMPLLVLEHWKLRRWLFLGGSRIGDAAVLWGSQLLGRSQLDVTARAGGTRLDATRDPLRDPFHRDAHQVSVFVPAYSVAGPEGRGTLGRLLREHVPAHVGARVVPVEPRMRIGIQASLGFDTVVGCWPPSVRDSSMTLGELRLGRATVLSGAAGPGGMPPRLGRDSRLRAGPPNTSTDQGNHLP